MHDEIHTRYLRCPHPKTEKVAWLMTFDGQAEINHIYKTEPGYCDECKKRQDLLFEACEPDQPAVTDRRSREERERAMIDRRDGEERELREQATIDRENRRKRYEEGKARHNERAEKWREAWHQSERQKKYHRQSGRCD